QTTFPADGPQQPDRGLHGRGHRRYERGRVRQRHAALGAHLPGRRLRPPACVHRPHARCRHLLCRAAPPVRSAEVHLGGLRHQSDQRGRRGVPRTAKSVQVTQQMRTALGLADDVSELSPADLIHACLQAPVDLVYNGGIGTYIKASTETDAEIGDRANDPTRVDAAQLRCKVVVEGGNLGASQLGRIEAAQQGVRINTDAIDNSAGVGSSDREVNLKILFTPLIKDGTLSLDERNELLVEMTDEVAALVLRDNYVQN